MKKKSVTGIAVLLAYLVGSVPSPSVTSQQPPPSLSPEQAQAIADGFRRAQADPSRPENLNRESKANDSAGIHLYSEHLIESIVPDRAGQRYISSLSDRLARAEELARAGNGNLVPEAKVAQAYNDLMRRIGAPASLYSDEKVVHRIRHFGLVTDPSPALFSAHQNGTNCNPGEAVFLLLSLFWNNGGPREDPPPGPAPQAGKKPPSVRWITGQVMTGPEAGILLSSYSAAHSRHVADAMFNGVARTLGF